MTWHRKIGPHHWCDYCDEMYEGHRREMKAIHTEYVDYIDDEYLITFEHLTQVMSDPNHAAHKTIYVCAGDHVRDLPSELPNADEIFICDEDNLMYLEKSDAINCCGSDEDDEGPTEYSGVQTAGQIATEPGVVTTVAQEVYVLPKASVPREDLESSDQYG